MGGVDVNSALAQGFMTCRQKTRRWSISLFYCMIDAMRTNAFILARRDYACRVEGGGRLIARQGVASLAGLLTGLCHGDEGMRAVRVAYGLQGSRPPAPATPTTQGDTVVNAPTRSPRSPHRHTQQRHREHQRYTSEELEDIPILEDFPMLEGQKTFLVGGKRYHTHCELQHPSRRTARFYCTQAGMSFCSVTCFNKWVGVEAMPAEAREVKRQRDMEYASQTLNE